MNRNIASLLKIQIADKIDWIDRLVGMVQPFKVVRSFDQGTSIIQVFPVSCEIDPANCDQKALTWVIPSSDIGCLVYFEDEGCTFVKKTNHGNQWQSRLLLVGWFNASRFESTDSCSIGTNLIDAIISSISDKPYNAGALNTIQHRTVAQLPKTDSIFAKYTYPDSKIQFTQKPYDYFALEIVTDFVVNKNCIDEIVKVDLPPC